MDLENEENNFVSQYGENEDENKNDCNNYLNAITHQKPENTMEALHETIGENEDNYISLCYKTNATTNDIQSDEIKYTNSSDLVPRNMDKIPQNMYIKLGTELNVKYENGDRFGDDYITCIDLTDPSIHTNDGIENEDNYISLCHETNGTTHEEDYITCVEVNGPECTYIDFNKPLPSIQTSTNYQNRKKIAPSVLSLVPLPRPQPQLLPPPLHIPPQPDTFGMDDDKRLEMQSNQAKKVAVVTKKGRLCCFFRLLCVMLTIIILSGISYATYLNIPDGVIMPGKQPLTTKPPSLHIYSTEAIFKACKNGNLSFITHMIQSGLSVNVQDNDTSSLALCAIENNKIDLLKYLVSKNADVNVMTGPFGSSPLLHAVYQQNYDVVKYLIDSNADVNQPSKDDQFCILLSVFTGYINMTKLLLDHDANVNQIGVNGTVTPLLIAAIENDLDMTTFLLEHGAQVNYPNNKGETPLSSAVEYGYIGVVHHLLHAEGVNVDVKTLNGYTPLIIASRQGYLEIVKLLIEKQANVNERDNIEGTALWYAVANGFLEIVKVVINANADINQPGMDKTSNLFAAIIFGHHDTLKYILEQGANVNIVDATDCTALDKAKELNDSIAINHLHEYKARSICLAK